MLPCDCLHPQIHLLHCTWACASLSHDFLSYALASSLGFVLESFLCFEMPLRKEQQAYRFPSFSLFLLMNYSASNPVLSTFHCPSLPRILPILSGREFTPCYLFSPLLIVPGGALEVTIHTLRARSKTGVNWSSSTEASETTLIYTSSGSGSCMTLLTVVSRCTVHGFSTGKNPFH